MFWNQIGQFCFRNLDHQMNDVNPIDFLTITSFEIQRLDSNTSRSSATVKKLSEFLRLVLQLWKHCDPFESQQFNENICQFKTNLTLQNVEYEKKNNRGKKNHVGRANSLKANRRNFWNY